MQKLQLSKWVPIPIDLDSWNSTVINKRSIDNIIINKSNSKHYLLRMNPNHNTVWQETFFVKNGLTLTRLKMNFDYLPKAMKL